MRQHGFPFSETLDCPIGGRTIHVRCAGSGKPILFLHGFPLDSRMWLPLIDRLSSQLLCLAPDFRGCGANPEERFSFSLEDLANDCIRLLDALAVRQPVTICGLSMGGYVAMRSVANWPERFSHVILTNTRAESDSLETKKRRIDLSNRVFCSDVPSVTAPMLSNLLAKSTLLENMPAVELVQQMMNSTKTSTFAWSQLAMAERMDSRLPMSKWTHPVLCIAGTDDSITPPEVVRSMSQCAPKTTMVTIPGTAHLSPLEAPDRFAEQLLHFLRD